jgi:hypothetical protein
MWRPFLLASSTDVKEKYERMVNVFRIKEKTNTFQFFPVKGSVLDEY